MQFQTLHRDVLQLISESNPYNWAIAPGDEKAFISYFRFDDLQSATNYGKNLISCGWATEFNVRPAERFETGGYEIKVRGLSQVNLEKLVEEMEAKDWINGVFFDAAQLEAQYQLHCDRLDLEADVYDSAWY